MFENIILTNPKDNMDMIGLDCVRHEIVVFTIPIADCVCNKRGNARVRKPMSIFGTFLDDRIPPTYGIDVRRQTGNTSDHISIPIFEEFPFLYRALDERLWK